MTTLIETMRVRHGALPLIWFHRLRLERSCEALGLPRPTFWADAGLRAAEVGDGVVRVMWNGVAEWSTRAVDADPVRIRTSAVAHQPYPHKSVSRDAFLRASRAAVPDEALLLAAGAVAETPRFAVVWWDGDELCTVDPAVGVLPSVGIERLGRTWPLTYRSPRREDLNGVPLAVVNAVQGIRPVESLDGVTCGPDARWETLAGVFWPA